MPDFTDNLKPLYDGVQTLVDERARSKINVEELAKHLLSRDDFYERQKRVTKILEGEPLFSKKQNLNLSRPDRYHVGLARAKALRRLTLKHGWDDLDFRMAEYLVDEVSPYHLHNSMFQQTIREQASDEQKAKLMPLVDNYEIIGCYAQTELGHGSNVRGVEALAKWDPKTKEFIIHSPTLTASKWWNGSMGRTANYAIVVAQLLLPKASSPTTYVNHGPHPFIVQIRDMKTHQPFDGIVVGDIGPKYGYTSMDNGYMLFDNYRVPHSAMLARYNRVDPDTGVLTKSGHPAVVYGTLTYVRANIIMHSRLILARACTIAIRYGAVRRQFKDRDAPNPAAVPELAVLDYPTVMIRLLPLLATTFALHYTGEAMYNIYWGTRKSIESGDFSKLAELHSASSGLKSLCTSFAADGIEVCRRSMGGHGFGGYSGILPLNNDYLSKPTVEGDNWMITQQVASYLIKKMETVVKNPNAASKDSTDDLFKHYLKSRSSKVPVDIVRFGQVDDQAIVEAFRWRAAHLSYLAYEARIVNKGKWNNLMIQLHKLSNAYSQTFLISHFYDAVMKSPLSSPTNTVMHDLYRLFALNTIDSDSHSFAATNAVTSASLDRIPDVVLHLMTDKIRPHAIKLVDSWSMPDYLLESSLGRYDGRVYEDMYDRVHRHNPLNKITFNPDWRNEEIVMGSGSGTQQVLAKL
ncbi:acyl-CoA oxidase [Rhizodiscina lignyota]|uniref:Acyl-coenzyme A oxidase n=1 Tax=Rhizodiscina lignyota TaxID=1504668 RepID=A0A9P4M8X4_9PEZI|nr:acyl-CoA oxidase [Rhizodiscina lignyota]